MLQVSTVDYCCTNGAQKSRAKILALSFRDNFCQDGSQTQVHEEEKRWKIDYVST